MLDVPDVNVWIALSEPKHSLRKRAEHYWHEEAADRLAFVPITMLGLLRLLTNKTVMQGAPLSSDEAWQVFQKWLAHPTVSLLQGPPGFHPAFHDWLRAGVVTTAGWMDAYLAATARSLGARVVSFDRGFDQFDGLDRLILKP